MTKTIRKALVALLIPILALPFADWLGGGSPFSWGTVVAAVSAGMIAALGVYFTPNAAP